jgi:hypothetical protein
MIVAYLCVPPPLSSVHVMKQLYGLIFISIVMLWYKYKKISEVRVAIQHFDAFNDVSVEDIKCFTCDNNLFVLELRSSRKVFVDDIVELF